MNNYKDTKRYIYDTDGLLKTHVLSIYEYYFGDDAGYSRCLATEKSIFIITEKRKAKIKVD